MATIEFTLFAAEYMAIHYGGSFSLTDGVLFFKNDIDEFYCDLKNKTEKGKIRFWHRYEGQEEYHRQIDRKNVVAGLYQCFTHINKYSGIKYDRQERIRIQRTVSEEWQKAKSKKKEENNYDCKRIFE